MATLDQLTQVKQQLDIAMKARTRLKQIQDGGDIVNLADDNDAAYNAPATTTQKQIIKDIANAAEAQIKTIANTVGF